MTRTMPERLRLPEPTAAKVPEITVLFWVIKILTTGMGEAASDYLGSLNLVLAGAVGLFGFLAALWWQLHTPRYVAVVYWTAVGTVAVFGTMAADVVHVVLRVPYPVTTSGYGALVALVLVLWWRSERTLSIHSIVTRRRETYYWCTVLATFALGTAAGDLCASTLGLGLLGSGLLFTAVIVIPLVAWRTGALGSIAAFWFAYVVTRPLGASFADWFSKPHRIGGLALGDGPVAGVALVVIAVFVGWVAVTRRDVQPVEPAAGRRLPVAAAEG